MNGQQTFSDIEYSMRKRTTKREAFLDAMDECIVWDEWCALAVNPLPSAFPPLNF